MRPGQPWQWLAVAKKIPGSTGEDVGAQVRTEGTPVGASVLEVGLLEGLDETGLSVSGVYAVGLEVTGDRVGDRVREVGEAVGERVTEVGEVEGPTEEGLEVDVICPALNKWRYRSVILVY